MMKSRRPRNAFRFPGLWLSCGIDEITEPRNAFRSPGFWLTCEMDEFTTVPQYRPSHLKRFPIAVFLFSHLIHPMIMLRTLCPIVLFVIVFGVLLERRESITSSEMKGAPPSQHP
jgi:hypothetical protein